MKSRLMHQYLHGAGGEEREEMSLQITSMADIFTIILIFLLKSAATGMTTINPPQGMVLPSVSTSAPNPLKEAVKVELLPNAVLVDSKPVLQIKDFDIPVTGQDLLRTMMGSGEIVLQEPIVSDKLVEVLTRERAKALSEGPATHLTVLAHEGAPYQTVRIIINSAASAGYGDLQLVVVGDN